MYSSSARGGHVFRPSIAAPPIPDNADEDDESTTAVNPPAGPSVTTAAADAENTITQTTTAPSSLFVVTSSSLSASTIAMDVDDGGTNPINPLLSSSKRPHSPTPPETNSSSSTAQTSSTSNTTTALSSSEPPAKKQSKGGSRHSGVSGKSVKDTSTPAVRTTPASAVIGMQGSINCLTDIFEKSMMSHLAEDPATTSRNRAIGLLQEQEDGLTTNKKIVMISCFMGNVIAANTYISLTDPEVRRGWLLSMISDQPT